MRHTFLTTVCLALFAGCSEMPVRQSRVFGAGEKALVDNLTYVVIDDEIQTRLGEDPTARFPQTRFVVVHLAISNGGSTSESIPGLALVGDAGKSYPELADGTGVPHWLGVERKVAPAATERGSVLFDAPAGHYKLKLTDETNNSDAFIDIPLSFVHEQMNDLSTPVIAAPDTPAVKK